MLKAKVIWRHGCIRQTSEAEDRGWSLTELLFCILKQDTLSLLLSTG